MLTESTIRRLEQRQEELALLFLEQSGPDAWRDLSTTQARGDTYWLKKNAAQTLGIMVRIQSLINMHMRAGGGIASGAHAAPVAEDEAAQTEGDETTALAMQAEADAMRIIDRVAKSKM